MTRIDGKTSAAAALCLAVGTVAHPSAAHDAGGPSDATATSEYWLAAAPLLAYEKVSVAGHTDEAGVFGAAMLAYVGRRLAPCFHTGLELAFGLVVPLGTFEFGEQKLEGVVIPSAALLWLNNLETGYSTFRLGLGPAVVHVFESSGALEERTTFGLQEQAGFSWRSRSDAPVAFDIGLMFTSTQAFTGSDYDATIDWLYGAGGMLTLGFTYGAPDAPPTK